MALGDDYDVAISYAARDRTYAEALAVALKLRKVKVFYDRYEQSSLWGQNLYTVLSDLYSNRANYCVMFISQHYASSMWTNHEREAAQARAMRENKEYILPVHLDDTEIPSILPTVAYLSLPPETIETIAEAIVAKLREMPNSLLASISQSSANGSSKKTKEKWMEEGNAHYKAGDHEQALAAYEQVLLLDPNDSVAYTSKGKVLYDINNFFGALSASDQAIQLVPHEAFAYSEMGFALIALGRLSDGLFVCEESIKRDPSYVPALLNKGKVLIDLGRFSEAIRPLEQAIQIDPNEVQLYVNMGAALSHLGHHRDALASLNTAIRLNPNEFLAHYNAGNVLIYLGHYDEAFTAFDRAIQIDPSDPRPWQNKGVLFERRGQRREAQQCYERARQLGLR